MKNQGGFAAVAAIVVTFLLLAIGGSAMVMSQLGYSTVASENKYQVANSAAERAVNAGVQNVISLQVCNLTATNVLANGATSFFFTTPDATSNYCFIYGRGTFGATNPATVVMTTVVPIAASNWGAMVLKNGGTLLIGGSSSIASCDANCRGPAVVSGGPISGQYTTDTTCKNNNKGIVGDPAIQYTELGDLVPKFFNSDNFGDLKNDIGNAYVVDVTGLSNTDIPGGCQYNGNKTCATTSATQIVCGSGGTAVTINLGGCPKVFVGASSSLSINHSVANTSIVAATSVSINDGLNHTNVFAANITFDLGAHDNTVSGIFYGRDSLNVQGNSNATLGTVDDPVLMITGGNLTKDGNGTVELNGLLFSEGLLTSVNNGNFSVNGSVINNNPNAVTLTANSGNAAINFNSTILNNLSDDMGFTKKPNCNSNANRKAFVTTTKMTAY
ncbi:MAG TPA: hypothetical protein VN260_08230 [Dissulfurispiraceae bacterium]|nr:hypothetical protein [Dissulfurispiraceae bacterium]